MNPNSPELIRMHYEVKYQLFKAETLSKLEALETQVKRLEEVIGL